eukprot:1831645-Amphidinium_carterae.2
MPGYLTVVPGRHKSQALPWVVVWTAKARLVVDPAPLSSVTVGSLDQGLCHRWELLRCERCARGHQVVREYHRVSLFDCFNISRRARPMSQACKQGCWNIPAYVERFQTTP